MVFVLVLSRKAEKARFIIRKTSLLEGEGEGEGEKKLARVVNEHHPLHHSALYIYGMESRLKERSLPSMKTVHE